MTTSPSLPPLPLPSGITSRFITTPSLTTHILEAGCSHNHDRPLIILLHGFPELAFSWRKVIPLLAADYHVVAPDQRGFGRTLGWDTRPYASADLHTFTVSSLVRDVVLLVYALGYTSVHCVVGHDCGAVTAAMCAVARPDLFRSVVLLSHPFNGMPAPAKELSQRQSSAGEDIHSTLLNHGRKHYKWYYSTPSANADMLHATGPDGLHGFLRGYFHLKSGRWEGNQPRMLTGWTAEELVKMPYYYVMPAESTMPEAVERHMREESEEGLRASREWLPDEDLAVYVREYQRTGFQGGLNWYRVRTAEGGQYTWDHEVFTGRKIDIPCTFVSGKLDWGIYQEPGALAKMENGVVCSDFREMILIDGVGHWAPQESPEQVAQAILRLAGGIQ
ncbi:alpha/beta fold hydrolase [Aspergillus saccharolyticus JOP 1030-1]|uniref:Putative epoxide hydrolase n=1 Tax=Aspergillus saccharolyticus JOP 1030-1 TaxID=1450539 RepID=A0A318ZQT8_9EURO|nr:putative epoxide hydrolase [Aspergillus saccharolyticus JOP 1030-1]PYH48934.1 putative epoxide hydrolase [Aspergillus saccharolyticus JOP 1030-1]